MSMNTRDEKDSGAGGFAIGTPVRYRPNQPEFFSIRYIGQVGRTISGNTEGVRHIFIEFPCGVVLLVPRADIEPVR